MEQGAVDEGELLEALCAALRLALLLSAREVQKGEAAMEAGTPGLIGDLAPLHTQREDRMRAR
jgi:hypothetical protein